MAEPGKLEKALLEIPGIVRSSGLMIDSMLRITKAVVFTLREYYRESEGEFSDSFLAMEEAYDEIPADLAEIRQRDSEEGE